MPDQETAFGMVRVERPQRLVDVVADQLRAHVLEGRIPPGTVLRQERLARELGVTRTPLREALARLRHEGIVQTTPSGVTRIVPLDRLHAIEIMELREVLDGLAARKLAERGVSLELERRLKDLNRQMTTAKRLQDPAYTSANCEFHVVIYEACGHSRLLQSVPMVRMSSQSMFVTPSRRNRTRISEQARVRESVEEHLKIVAAMVAGEWRAAESAARRHIRSSKPFWGGMSYNGARPMEGRTDSEQEDGEG